MTAVRPTDRLFFAVVPESAAAERIARLGEKLRQVHRLRGKPILPQHLHITLWHVGDAFFTPSSELISTLVRRAGYVEMPSFRISFDRVMSFRNGAFVLTGAEGIAGLEMLHERLQAVLALPGRRPPRSAFTPHMTLLRDERLLPSRPIDPIDWTAREIVLVHSLLGRTTHRHLARLPLS
jgi:2'-5' RNA ligase